MTRLFATAVLCLTVSACALPVPLMALSGTVKLGAFIFEEEEAEAPPPADSVTVSEMLARVRGEAPEPPEAPEVSDAR